jgi:Fuc2NAc and GlcNAc transferase
MTLKIFLIFTGAFFTSCIFTWVVRVYALSKNILDIPNERSSHIAPVPRGGGIAIIITFILSLSCLRWLNIVEQNLFMALMGGIVIGALGCIDDVYSVAARIRIIVHFMMSIWVLYWLQGFAGLEFTKNFLAHWINLVLASIAIVWCINFYNFMDGIDGLASGQGIFIGLSSGVAFLLCGASSLSIVMFLFTASIAGFMVWNWPPAKIFLGDVGSGFIGYIFSVMIVYSASKKILPLEFWLIIFVVFAGDATFTLIKRAYQKKNWYSAHREHAYQSLIISGASHKEVTLKVLGFNCFFLLPLAFLTLFFPNSKIEFFILSVLVFFRIWEKINKRDAKYSN